MTGRTRLPVQMIAVFLVALAASQAMAEGAAADSVRKYKFLGKTARDKSDHEDAVRYYTSLLSFQSDYHLAYYYIARAHLALGQQDQAKTALLAAVALKPQHANTNLLLFQVYVAESKPDTAWLYLGRLVAADPEDNKYREYRRTVADLSRRAGDVDTAIGHYEAIATDSATPKGLQQELFELLAVMYDDQDDPGHAIEWRRKLDSTGGAENVESLAKMVELQIATNDYKGARKTLKTLTHIDSSSRYSHFVRIAELGDKAGDPAMRLEGLEGMARSQPKDLETVATIAQIHLNDDDLSAAGLWLRRGLTQVPADAQLRVLNGDLLMRNEAPEEKVIAEYEIALKDPNWAAVAQQRIWQIRPPETEEEKLRKAFFGHGNAKDGGS